MSSEKRSYRSDTRQAKAELTRKTILAAARKTFAVQGFERATIDGIAEKAGVSTPLIYAQFKSKEGLLRALLDSAVFGPEYNALVGKVLAQQEPAKRLQAVAKITRYIYETESQQARFIYGAGIISAELRKLERDLENQRYERQEAVVRHLCEIKATRAGVPVSRLRDIVWALTGGDLYRMLVRERKWSSDEYETWLGNLLQTAVLK